MNVKRSHLRRMTEVSGMRAEGDGWHGHPLVEHRESSHMTAAVVQVRHDKGLTGMES
jgi:hypothetical protein